MLGSIYMGFKKHTFRWSPTLPWCVYWSPPLSASQGTPSLEQLPWQSCLTCCRRCVMLCAIFCCCIVIFTFGALWCAHYILYIYWTTLTWCFYVSSSFNTYTKVLMFECFVVFSNVSFSLQFCSCSIVHQKVLPCPASIISASESCRVVTTSATWEPKPSHTSMKHLPPQRK